MSRTQVTDLLDRHGLAPSRALGQNFLVDRGTIDKIVRLAGVGPGDAVVEIGPGLGSLTTGLLGAGADVVAVEVDRYLVPAFEEVTAPWSDQPGTRLDRRLRLVVGDAREVAWADVLDDEPWTVVANLPYNIATPLILDLLAEEPRLTRWLVMVQREAGERLCAGPGSRTYGIPSVLVAYWGTARLVGSIRPDVFLPRPRVDSVLVAIERGSEPRVQADFGRLSELVRAAFGQRRKMLRRSLAAHVPERAMLDAGVEPTARPEQLSVDDWGRLATVAS
ncbi:MAG: 16S rRNA (adenine(1518)-N(6)/adenine(1519)-N(6))-dimethyltransferase RsmA [Actinomycetota bacterium]